MCGAPKGGVSVGVLHPRGQFSALAPTPLTSSGAAPGFPQVRNASQYTARSQKVTVNFSDGWAARVADSLPRESTTEDIVVRNPRVTSQFSACSLVYASLPSCVWASCACGQQRASPRGSPFARSGCSDPSRLKSQDAAEQPPSPLVLSLPTPSPQKAASAGGYDVGPAAEDGSYIPLPAEDRKRWFEERRRQQQEQAAQAQAEAAAAAVVAGLPLMGGGGGLDGEVSSAGVSADPSVVGVNVNVGVVGADGSVGVGVGAPGVGDPALEGVQDHHDGLGSADADDPYGHHHHHVVA